MAAAVLAYLTLACDVSLWHPWYAYGDERLLVCRLEDLREGARFLWRFGRGDLSLALLWGWVRLAGPGMARLHVPDLVLAALEWAALTLLARRWLGREASWFALLALTLCAQTLVRERSLLAFQALPAEAALLGLSAAWVRGRPGAVLWGLAAGCAFLDYDGSLIAVPGMMLAAAAFEPGFRARVGSAFAAMAAVAAVLAVRQRGDWASYAAVRLGTAGSAATDPGLSGRLAFARELLTGGPNLPYFGVTGWPAWAPWAWPGLAAGLWMARRGPARSLALWAVGGTATVLAVHSAYGLPVHRMAAVVPALALLSGAGFAGLRRRLGPAAAPVLGALLVLGALSEGWAWCRHQWAFGPELYDRCQALGLLRRAHQRELSDPATRVVVQLDGMFDEDARLTLGVRPWPAGAPWTRVLAVVPAGYLGGLDPRGPAPEVYWAEKGLEPAVAVVVAGAEARRLALVEDTIAPLLGREEGPAAAAFARFEAWLDVPVPRDPWTRTAALEGDLQEGLQSRGVGPRQMARLAAARGLVSDAPWMALARAVYAAEPKVGVGLAGQALRMDPRDGEALLVEAACLRALGDPRAAEVQGDWVRLREAGKAWRHTL